MQEKSEIMEEYGIIELSSCMAVNKCWRWTGNKLCGVALNEC